MAVKRAARKTTEKTAAAAGNKPKLALPAFGLAEDILESAGADYRSVYGEPEHCPSDALTAMPSEDGRLVRMPAETAQEKDLHLVTFHLDREEFGVAIDRVQEIIRVGQMTTVPNAPSFIRGVINLRGRIIPVLDLRKRLALPDAGITKQSRIMVVEAGPKVLGLLVDRVSQVLRLPHSAVDAPPEDLDESRGFVRGIGKLDSRLVMIVELDRVLARDARQASAMHPIAGQESGKVS